jgi:signal transduction histidine kinase
LHEIAKVAIQARDQFLAIVSHDLKNPLSSIAMSADIIRHELVSPNGDTTGLIEYVDIIDRNAANMERMINDLLDIERMSQGKLKIEPTCLNVSSLLEECKTLFGPVAAKKSFEITVTPTDTQLTAEMDHDRILQVLSNLLGNALKFSPSGSRITIAAHTAGADIEFSVKDNGPGISPDAKLKVFERFSQIKFKDRRGLGLGLFISKWIVEAHHGKIWVESELGQGSDFKFLIPAFCAAPSH